MRTIQGSLRRKYILFFAMGLTAEGARDQTCYMRDAKVLIIAACSDSWPEVSYL